MNPTQGDERGSFARGTYPGTKMLHPVWTPSGGSVRERGGKDARQLLRFLEQSWIKLHLSVDAGIDCGNQDAVAGKAGVDAAQVAERTEKQCRRDEEEQRQTHLEDH